VSIGVGVERYRENSSLRLARSGRGGNGSRIELGSTLLLAVAACQPPALIVVADDATGSAEITSAEPATSGEDSSTGENSTDEDSSGESSSGESSSGESPTLPPIEPSHVVYLAFEGLTILPAGGPGLDDATQNQSELVAEPIELAPWEGAPPDAIIEVLEATWIEYGVGFTTRRPTSGAYTMVVFISSLLPDSEAIAHMPTDCGNSNPSNVGFFTGVAMQAPPLINARLVSLSLGQSYGLHPQDQNADDLMFLPFNAPGGSFLDECLETIGAPCRSFLTAGCPSGTQNSHQELLAVLDP
jgi:hypothetical protein